MEPIHEKIVNLLADAGAVVGNAEHLTTAEVADRLDIEQNEAEDLLSELKWEHGMVLKGPDVGDAGDQWRLDDTDE